MRAMVQVEEVLILFRVIFLEILHPSLTAYAFTYSPNHVSIGLFRAPIWASDVPWRPHTLSGRRDLLSGDTTARHRR
jgi:hypothetical protein